MMRNFPVIEHVPILLPTKKTREDVLGPHIPYSRHLLSLGAEDHCQIHCKLFFWSQICQANAQYQILVEISSVETISRKLHRQCASTYPI